MVLVQQLADDHVDCCYCYYYDGDDKDDDDDGVCCDDDAGYDYVPLVLSVVIKVVHVDVK